MYGGCTTNSSLASSGVSGSTLLAFDVEEEEEEEEEEDEDEDEEEVAS
jgi:hypothetical protein